MAQAQGSLDDGRQMQFDEMMQAFRAIQARYKGVRGELLEKVREELMRLKPTKGASAPAPTPPNNVEPIRPVSRPVPQHKAEVAKMLPSCRSCGRTMRQREDGVLVCQNGHTRQLAG